MNIPFQVAKTVAGATRSVLQGVFHRTAGALPGKLAYDIDHNILADLRNKMSESSILVVASNGKTTVTNLVADVLEADGRKIICNRGGANMLVGIASTLLAAEPAEWGVFETDELWLAHILPQLKSRYVLLLDIFPDQEDRMGGTGRLVESITAALTANPETTLIYNADEPNCRAIAAAVPNPCIAVGAPGVFADNKVILEADNAVVPCPVCGEPLDYAWRQYGPVGDYECPACAFHRGDFASGEMGAASYQILNAQVNTEDSAWTLALPEGGSWYLKSTCGAAYMVYNMSFAAAACHCLRVSAEVVGEAFAAFDPRNGRMEALTVEGRETLVNLVKNPVGFNQNLQLVLKHEEPCVVGLFINNNVGDGVDVSWLKKVEFAALAPRVVAGNMKVFAAGMVQAELLEALVAAGVPAQPCETAAEVLTAAEALPENGRIYLLANYTQLPAVRATAEAAAAFSAGAER